VFVIYARQVIANVAGIRHNDADVAYVDHELGNSLDGCKQPVDVIRAFDQGLQLPTTPPASPQEFFRVLEVIVIGGGNLRVIANGGRDDVTLAQRRAIVNRDHANQIVRALDHNGVEAIAVSDERGGSFEIDFLFTAQRQVIVARFGKDHELRQVDRIRAFTQKLALRAALPTMPEKALNILESLAFRHDLTERLRRVQR